MDLSIVNDVQFQSMNFWQICLFLNTKGFKVKFLHTSRSHNDLLQDFLF
jgi:hypothetical protein